MSARPAAATLLGAIFTGLLSGCADEKMPRHEAEADAGAPRLQLKLEARDTSFALDLGGLDEKLAQKQLRAIAASDALERKLPPAPRVELTLRLVNRGTNEVTADIPANWYTLELSGPAAVEHSEYAMGCIPPPAVTIESGESHVAETHGMSYFTGKASKTWFWTKPGKYVLKARARLHVDGRLVELDSNALEFQVKKAESAASAPANGGLYQLVPPISK